MSRYKGLTYGEAVAMYRANMDFRLEPEKIVAGFDKLPPRLKRRDAINYYTHKLSKLFYEPTTKDFLEVEHYYDYFEALRIADRHYEQMVIDNQSS
jgi:hypothetical protein